MDYSDNTHKLIFKVLQQICNCKKTLVNAYKNWMTIVISSSRRLVKNQSSKCIVFELLQDKYNNIRNKT